jgi:hypothetical protein
MSVGQEHSQLQDEYIWRYVREDVVDGFRETFKELEKKKLFTRDSDHDLFCLQRVFIPVVQEALDDFRTMWNEHVIVGPRFSLSLDIPCLLSCVSCLSVIIAV